MTPEEAGKERLARQASFNRWRNHWAGEYIKLLLEAEMKSSLTINEFFVALLHIAKNDAMLKAALESGSITTGIPDAAAASKALDVQPETTQPTIP